MARKPNYDFEKRRKEQERKAKKDAKREDRQRRRDEGIIDDGIASGDEIAELTGERPAETTPADAKPAAE